jgi:hypothetical protein
MRAQIPLEADRLVNATGFLKLSYGLKADDGIDVDGGLTAKLVTKEGGTGCQQVPIASTAKLLIRWLCWDAADKPSNE